MSGFPYGVFLHVYVALISFAILMTNLHRTNQVNELIMNVCNNNKNETFSGRNNVKDFHGKSTL